MKKNHTVCSQLKNKTMNDEVYKLRRKVMGFIYEAKELVPDMPRVEVRITDNHEDRILAMGRLGSFVIWISERVLSMSDDSIRCVVYHEILHNYGHEHNNRCSLMGAYHKELSKEEAQKLFVKWVKKSNNVRKSRAA